MSEQITTADIARRNDSVAEAEQAPSASTSDETTGRRTALFDTNESEGLRARWDDVQTRFVDSPQQAVQDADALVAELMQRLAETFANERSALEQQWTRGEDVTTEDLRIALTRYRSFFERLLDA